MTITQIQVNRAAIAQCRIATTAMPVIGDGEVLMQIERVALTANNVTYAVAGDMIGYWQFYPVDSEWGIVPVWGFARVIQSRCDGAPVGTQVWGFMPMASHVVMTPTRASVRGFVDGAPHRAALPAVYNQYARTNDDDAALAAIADARSLLFPLFTTSWLIADYLADNGWFGAAQVIIGSASSKTGFGTAHFIANGGHPNPPTVTGLTSNGNMDFVTALGFYDTAVTYADIAGLDPALATVYVDMSGDGDVLAAIHNHFGDNVKASIGVGITHWEQRKPPQAMPGAAPEFFFAPSQIAKRDAEWGAGETMRRANTGNAALVAALEGRLTISDIVGADAIAVAYRAMALGTTPPSQGIILDFRQ